MKNSSTVAYNVRTLITSGSIEELKNYLSKTKVNFLENSLLSYIAQISSQVEIIKMLIDNNFLDDTINPFASVDVHEMNNIFKKLSGYKINNIEIIDNLLEIENIGLYFNKKNLERICYTYSLLSEDIKKINHFKSKLDYSLLTDSDKELIFINGCKNNNLQVLESVIENKELNIKYNKRLFQASCSTMIIFENIELLDYVIRFAKEKKCKVNALQELIKIYRNKLLSYEIDKIANYIIANNNHKIIGEEYKILSEYGKKEMIDKRNLYFDLNKEIGISDKPRKKEKI